MRKKFLIACSLFLCLSMVGCGASEAGTSATEAPAAVEPATAEPPANMVVDEAPEGAEEYVAPEVVAEETEEIVTEAPEEIRGIVLLAALPGLTDKYEIICIDPDSGSMRKVSSFSVVRERIYEDEEQYNYFNICYGYPHEEYRDLFSPDYTKLAVSKVNGITGESHVGWMSTDGTFTDVTEILLPGYDTGFYELPQQYAFGFTEDGKLIYRDGTTPADPFYCVAPSDLSPGSVQESSHPNDIYIGDSAVTDFINDDTYLVNYFIADSIITCKKYSASTKEFSDFIPETSRCNWSATISPDGGSVAFLSKPNKNDGNAEIFTIPVDGGDPVKVNLSTSLQSLYGDISMNMMPGVPDRGVSCILLDWR